jgi:hypothetical protein
VAEVLREAISMASLRKLGILAAAFGAVLVALSPRRRTLVAQKLKESRRFVSQRILDRDARDSQAREQWDDDGGAREGSIAAPLR